MVCVFSPIWPVTCGTQIWTVNKRMIQNLLEAQGSMEHYERLDVQTKTGEDDAIYNCKKINLQKTLFCLLSYRFVQ